MNSIKHSTDHSFVSGHRLKSFAPKSAPGATPRRKLRVLLGVLATLAAAIFGAPAAHAAYEPVSYDNFNLYSSNSAVQASGYVQWYKDPRGWYQPAVYRGQYNGWVQLRDSGCLYVKITWYTASGSVSWPPSGSASTTTDGWYQKCGSPWTWVSITGQAHASTSLYRTCFSIGYGRYGGSPRSFQSSSCMYNQ